MRRPSGFTLIEIMVALTLFALMAVLAYGGLDGVLRARAHVDEDGRKWRALALALASMQQSLAAAVDRPIRDRDGGIAPALAGAATVRHEEEPQLAFTRTGLPGHNGALADSQRVGYRLRAGRLEQLGWQALDQAPRSEPQALELLQGVENMVLRYLGRQGGWRDSWPPPGELSLPAAVELKLGLASGEQVTRLFVLP